jgi:hypothetical protein
MKFGGGFWTDITKAKLNVHKAKLNVRIAKRDVRKRQIASSEISYQRPEGSGKRNPPLHEADYRL